MDRKGEENLTAALASQKLRTYSPETADMMAKGTKKLTAALTGVVTNSLRYGWPYFWPQGEVKMPG